MSKEYFKKLFEDLEYAQKNAKGEAFDTKSLVKEAEIPPPSSFYGQSTSPASTSPAQKKDEDFKKFQDSKIYKDIVKLFKINGQLLSLTEQKAQEIYKNLHLRWPDIKDWNQVNQDTMLRQVAKENNIKYDDIIKEQINHKGLQKIEDSSVNKQTQDPEQEYIKRFVAYFNRSDVLNKFIEDTGNKISPITDKDLADVKTRQDLYKLKQVETVQKVQKDIAPRTASIKSFTKIAQVRFDDGLWGPRSQEAYKMWKAKGTPVVKTKQEVSQKPEVQKTPETQKTQNEQLEERIDSAVKKGPEEGSDTAPVEGTPETTEKVKSNEQKWNDLAQVAKTTVGNNINTYVSKLKEMLNDSQFLKYTLTTKPDIPEQTKIGIDIFVKRLNMLMIVQVETSEGKKIKIRPMPTDQFESVQKFLVDLVKLLESKKLVEASKVLRNTYSRYKKLNEVPVYNVPPVAGDHSAQRTINLFKAAEILDSLGRTEMSKRFDKTAWETLRKVDIDMDQVKIVANTFWALWGGVMPLTNEDKIQLFKQLRKFGPYRGLNSETREEAERMIGDKINMIGNKINEISKQKK